MFGRKKKHHPFSSWRTSMTEWDMRMLATYNAERARGIVHTEEWASRMSEYQRMFDNAARRELQDYSCE